MLYMCSYVLCIMYVCTYVCILNLHLGFAPDPARRLFPPMHSITGSVDLGLFDPT